MGIEAASFISELDSDNPVGGVDDYATADDHLRLIKSVLQGQFPNLTALAINPTVVEFNKLVGLTATTAELNKLDGFTGVVGDLNILSGAAVAGVTAAEFLHLNGVTSAIQTQLNAKQPLDADLSAIAALAKADGNIIVGNGSTWITEAGATARSSLGVAIGSDVQAWNVNLDQLALIGAPGGADQFIVSSGANAWQRESATSARTSLGLGTLATLSSINNSNWSGTDLAVANGGTGSSTASGARTNLGLGTGDTPDFNGVHIGSTDSTITRDSAGKIAIEGRPIAHNDNGALTSCRMFFSTAAPSGGASGDIWFEHEA